MADRKKSGIVEWTIENFSYWNREVHGERLVSPKFNFSAKFKVFPRGLQNGHDNMVVKVERTSSKHLPRPGHLFWLRSSDGKIIHTQKVNREADDLGKTSFPTFEKVVSLIGEHEDGLTLRYAFENAKNNFKESMRTVIEVINVTFQMDVDSILGGEIKSDIDYSRTRKPAMLYLRSVPNAAELTLERYKHKRPCYVRSFVTVAKGDTLLETYSEEYLFCDATPSWVVVGMRKRGQGCTHVSLRLRIAGGAVSKKHCLRLTNYTDTTARYSVCFAERKSSTGLDFHDDSATVDWIADSYDLRLRCGDLTFPVHKAILSAGSPFFETVLSTDDNLETLDIKDLDPSTLGLFLTHLYAGSAGELQYDSARKLLSAAEEYQVPSLERECDAFFADFVNKSEPESGSPPPGDREETGAEEASSSVGSSKRKSSTSLDLDDSATIDWISDSYDLRIRCGNFLFPVHKTVLSAMSPLFKIMFSNFEIKTLDVGDLDPSTLVLLLTYLYTENLRDYKKDDSTLKLFHAAEKYDVPSLKSKLCHLFKESKKEGSAGNNPSQPARRV